LLRTATLETSLPSDSERPAPLRAYTGRALRAPPPPCNTPDLHEGGTHHTPHRRLCDPAKVHLVRHADARCTRKYAHTRTLCRFTCASHTHVVECTYVERVQRESSREENQNPSPQHPRDAHGPQTRVCAVSGVCVPVRALPSFLPPTIPMCPCATKSNHR
jgi:hypothetical protein